MQEMMTAFGKELELREAHDAVATKTERDQVGYSNKKMAGGKDSPKSNNWHKNVKMQLKANI